MVVAVRLTSSLSRCWRGCATAFCFFAFGVGGFFLSVVWTPLVTLVVRDPGRRARLLRQSIHVAFRAFVALMNGLGVLRYEIIEAQRLATPGQLVIATHPTLIDVVFLMSLIRDGVCVVKQPLVDHLPFGPLLRGAGYIGNADAPASLETCTERLRDGVSVVLFPEGTRTGTTDSAPLRRGTAHLVLACGRDPIPVRISCEPPTLDKAHPYYEIPDRRVHFRIEVGMPLAIARDSPCEARSRRARQVTEQIRRHLSGDTTIYG